MIAGSEIVSPKFSADETLVASVLSTNHFGCSTGITSNMATLLAMFVVQGGVEAQKRVKSYETLRREGGVCWIEQKNIRFLFLW